MSTTTEIREFFDQNGYYLAKDVYSSDEIESMESDFDRIVGQLSSGDENINARWGSRLTADLEPADSVIFHTHNVQAYSSVWLNAIQQKKFLDIADAILGPDIILHHTKLFQKPPKKGSAFPMHQDWQYFPTIHDTMIAGVVHVSEATDEMGCFRVYPGSHKELGRCEGMMGSGQNAEVHKQYPIDKATVLQAESGDVVFFHYFTLHGSMPNSSLKTRKTVLVQLYAGNDKVEDGNGHTDVRLVLRGWNHMATRSIAGSI